MIPSLTIGVSSTVALVFLCSCATGHRQAPTVQTQTTVGQQVATAPDPAQEPPFLKPSTGLARGRCNVGFDCVDTVGFPPAGQRWACVEGVCRRTELPNWTPATSSADDPTVADSQSTARTKRSTKRQND
jgi:hypothetical protein